MPSPHLEVQAPVLQVGSALQSGVQPSRQVWLPSSHGSLPSCTPLPHTALPVQFCGTASSHFLPGSILQAELQPSPPVVSPSSHCSAPSLKPSPQMVRQAKPSRAHSQPGSTIRQFALQPSPVTKFLSSQISGPLITPSPHF